jgi:hypothetical protein
MQTTGPPDLEEQELDLYKLFIAIRSSLQPLNEDFAELVARRARDLKQDPRFDSPPLGATMLTGLKGALELITSWWSPRDKKEDDEP